MIPATRAVVIATVVEMTVVLMARVAAEVMAKTLLLLINTAAVVMVVVVTLAALLAEIKTQVVRVINNMLEIRTATVAILTVNKEDTNHLELPRVVVEAGVDKTSTRAVVDKTNTRAVADKANTQVEEDKANTRAAVTPAANTEDSKAKVDNQVETRGTLLVLKEMTTRVKAASKVKVTSLEFQRPSVWLRKPLETIKLVRRSLLWSGQ